MQEKSMPPLEVKIGGDWACFTRPETKVERVSYPIITPSAARGVLEAIFWKPEFAWQVEEIQVLRPIRYFSIMRNEVLGRQTAQIARKWQKDGGGFAAADNRVQRHTLALWDVAYILKATPILKGKPDENPAKYRDQFRRRVDAGRCFSAPYLGCREFAAWFCPPDGTEIPVDLTEDLGSMLLTMEYDPNGSGTAAPRFFNANLDQGVLHVPEILKGAAPDATAKAG